MKHKESGRSMIEILGVLSIIALLSIIGLEGYRWAMNKSKANEITKQIMIRAQEVSSSLQQGTDPEEIIDDVNGVDIFPAKYDDKTHQYDSGELPLASDKRFAVGVDKVSPDICKELMNSLLGSSTGIQKVQQRIGSSFKELSKASDCSKETSSELGFVFQADLTNNCEPGRYRVDAICQDAPDGYISDGTGEIEQCDKGMTSNKTHTECVNCTAGEKCGCEKMANGDGGCMDCLKNADCTSGKVCSDKGACYICPAYADCNHDQGFTCLDGYEKTLNLCCPKQANCTIDETGKLKINCSKDYYLANDLCKECPINADCLGGDKNYSCKSGFKDQDGICCPTGATCTPDGDDYKVSCPKDTYLHDKECLPCPTGAKCNGGEEWPTCPAGYIFDGTACQRTSCQAEQGERYTCYINGKKCGFYCTDTKMEKNSCRGYCSSEYCKGIGTWGTTIINWSGLGCYDDKLYCGTYEQGNEHWICTRLIDKDNYSGDTPCCTGPNFGECKYGTCDDKICDQFNDNDTVAVWEKRISDRKGGCKITYNGKTTYWFPYDDHWVGKWEKTTGWNSGICAQCSLDELKAKSGNCAKCFGEFTCPASWKGATWNGKRCVGPGNDGKNYSCDLTGRCYFELTDNLCADGCTDLTPLNTCGVGYCDATKCKNNNLVYNATAKYGGCLTTYTGSGGGAFVFVPGWGGNKCYYGTTENNIKTLCGYDCQSTTDCSKCKTPLLAQCTNEKCRIDGQEIKNCVCDGDKANASNGHCCPPNHTYINGACSVIGDTNGQCLFRSYKFVAETDDYKSDNAGNCQCTDTTKCLYEIGDAPSCLPTTETLQRDAQGKCKAK